MDLAERDRRLLSMLALGIFGRRHDFANLDEALRAMWDNRAARDELVEVLEILGEEADTATRPLDFGPAPGARALHARRGAARPRRRHLREAAHLARGRPLAERPPHGRALRHLAQERAPVLAVNALPRLRALVPTVPLGVAEHDERGQPNRPSLPAAASGRHQRAAVRAREPDTRKRRRRAVHLARAGDVRRGPRRAPDPDHMASCASRCPSHCSRSRGSSLRK